MRTRLLAIAAFGVLLGTAAFVGCIDDVAAPPGLAVDAGGTIEHDASGSDGSLVDAARDKDGEPAQSDSGPLPPVDGGSDAAPPFDVSQLDGVRLWLESSKGLDKQPANGDAFGAWFDRSGDGDGGPRHVAKPYDVNPPTINANGFGGHPTLSFVNGNGYIAIANHEDFKFGLGDFLIVDVAKVSSGQAPGALWSLFPQQTAGSEESFSPNGFCFLFGMGVTDGCTSEAPNPSPEPHVFVARRQGDEITFRVDGAVQGKVDRAKDPADINVFNADNVYIGKNATMQLSEVIVIVGPTSDAKLALLEGFLKKKYLIP